MAQVINVEGFVKFNFLEIGELAQDAAAGAVSLVLVNGDNYDDDHAVLVGDAGHESSEICIPSAVTTNTLTVPATKFAHKKGTKVYKLRGHKAKVYRAANVDGTRPTSTGDYSLINGGLITLQADQLETEVVDATGGANFWYTYVFYNDLPSSPEEGEIVLTDAVRGGNVGNYTNVDSVRHEAGLDSNRYISDGQIYEKLIQAESEINATLVMADYELPLTTIPQEIVNCANLLAAGYLLTVDYGPEHEGTSKDGLRKIEMAKDILKRITEGTLLLLGADQTPLSTAEGVRGYPDDTVETEYPNQPMFSVHDKF